MQIRRVAAGWCGRAVSLDTRSCPQWCQAVQVQIPTCQTLELEHWTAGGPCPQARVERRASVKNWEMGLWEQPSQSHRLHLPGFLTAFPPEETPEQPEHSCPAGEEPEHLRSHQEFRGDSMCWVLRGKRAALSCLRPGQAFPTFPGEQAWLNLLGEAAWPVALIQCDVFFCRTQTASPSLKSTSPLHLPRASRVQVTPVERVGGAMGQKPVCSLESTSWGSLGLIPCEGLSTALRLLSSALSAALLSAPA